jgi:putative phosphotransacetylase
MSRPIPLDIIPSHVYLSQEDQDTLFGVGHPMTVSEKLSQPGQYVYEESVDVFGKLKRSIKLRILGPIWESSHIEITPTEAAFLGLNLEEVKSGDTRAAGKVRLTGPHGEVELAKGAIIPRPHLLCAPSDAESLHVSNGDEIAIDIISEKPKSMHGLIVRVHPAFRLRVEMHADYARDLWITRSTHARIRL